MKEKIVLVTGANSGIGKVTASELARMGAHVVMLCRSKERGELARKDIIQESGNEKVDLMICDLAQLNSVRFFAEDFKERYDRLDVLVNNAGGYIGQRRITEDGYEYTFAMNHLGHFLLTNLLLNLIIRSSAARIINVSSNAHRPGRIDFNDLMAENSYVSFRAYSQSKLANILFTYELDRRLNNPTISVNAVHPGVVGTNFGAEGEPFFRFLIKLGKPLLRSPKKGAETLVFLASSNMIEGVSGRYFMDKKERRSSAESCDLNVARRLWEVSEKLVGIDNQQDFNL